MIKFPHDLFNMLDRMDFDQLHYLNNRIWDVINGWTDDDISAGRKLLDNGSVSRSIVSNPYVTINCTTKVYVNESADDKLNILIPVPGLNKKNIKANVVNSEVKIWAEKNESEEKDKKKTEVKRLYNSRNVLITEGDPLEAITSSFDKAILNFSKEVDISKLKITVKDGVVFIEAPLKTRHEEAVDIKVN